jgi:hypothetical protein
MGDAVNSSRLMCHRVVGVVIVIFFIIVGVRRSEFIPRLVLVWQTSRLESSPRGGSSRIVRFAGSAREPEPAFLSCSS